MRAYRTFSLVLAVIFAVVGLCFLAMPARVIGIFNDLSASVGMRRVSEVGNNFYLALAVAYMYLVTLFAALMYRHPASARYPMLLAHAKLASAALSFYLFAVHVPFLLYLGNGIVDGGIGIVALVIHLKKRRANR